VQKKLVSFGRQVHWELPYPASPRRKCDLVIHVGAASRLWLELKVAWKAWFSCERGPTYSNSSYLPYLQGKHHSHSFRGNFEKLGSAGIPGDGYRAVLLIGFDCARAPMNGEVAAVVQAACQEIGPWEPAAERHWLDRRCHDFRINVWSWVLQPQA
jgi:hypothetical protein